MINSIWPSYQICHMEMNQDKVHKRRLWSNIRQFAHKYIRITMSFHILKKILAIPTNNSNVSPIEEPVSSININHNKDPWRTQNSKKHKRIQMYLWTNRKWKSFSTKLQIQLKTKFNKWRNWEETKVFKKSKLYFPNL